MANLTAAYIKGGDLFILVLVSVYQLNIISLFICYFDYIYWDGLKLDCNDNNNKVKRLYLR